MHIDEAGADNTAPRIQFAVRFFLECGTDAQHTIVLDPQVCDLIDMLRRIDDSTIGNAKNTHDAPS